MSSVFIHLFTSVRQWTQCLLLHVQQCGQFISKTGHRTLPTIDRFISLLKRLKRSDYIRCGITISVLIRFFRCCSFSHGIWLYVAPHSLCTIRCLHSKSEMQGMVVTAIRTSITAESPWSQSNWLQNQRFDLLEVQSVYEWFDEPSDVWAGALWTMPFTNGARRRLHACIRATGGHFE